MSRITISFNTDNAAFEDNPFEVKRILNKLAERISYDTPDQITLLDINGRNIGLCIVSDDD
tara:strand:- start:508 stop:690 length:183 start_codon:yes stop_codon:yes gene_type:complete